MIADKTGKFLYCLQEDGTAAIARCLEKTPELHIPEFLDGLKVTALLQYSIDENETQTVFIPKTVSSIQDGAFLAEWIQAVVVDKENPHFQIWNGMLINLKECSIVFCPPENAVSELIVPSWIRSVRDFAFSCCVHLKQIAFPHGFESIGYEAFEHCKELTDVSMPCTTRIGDWAFDDCPKLNIKYLK